MDFQFQKYALYNLLIQDESGVFQVRGQAKLMIKLVSGTKNAVLDPNIDVAGVH